MSQNRKRLGIVFNFSPKWMGGVVYVLNIVKVMNYLEDAEKPMVFIFYNPNLKRFVDEIDYPYLEKIEWQYPSVYKEFLRSFVLRKNTFVEGIITQYQLDTVFPLHDFPVKSKLRCKLVSWYADLQHCYYPEFFTKLKRFERNARIRLILKNTSDLVVSSHAVKEDFYTFFKVPKSLKIHVYHFVSIIDAFPKGDFEQLRKQYNLPQKYFMISNQFHRHKNHKVAFEAIALLKKQGKMAYLVLTGKLPEDDGSAYLTELKTILTENKLEDQIIFLGVLPRDIQLAIMQQAQAVVQPSLFEGWSTVIEDAKSLQVPVIASDLKVNIEQLGEQARYFEPHNAARLAQFLEEAPARNTSDIFYESYDSRIKKAASELLQIFE